MQQIPLSQIPSQSFNIVLDGQNCTVGLDWRQTRLYLDLEVEDALVCQGAICQNLASVIWSPSHNFKGSLHFLDLEGQQPPHWEELHTGEQGRFVLLYISAEEDLPLALRY